MDKKNKQKEVTNISFLTVEEHKELHSNNMWPQHEEELRLEIERKFHSSMQRLEGLCKEKVQVAELHYLSFNAMETCFKWYDHEIEVCNENIKAYRERLEEMKANETI